VKHGDDHHQEDHIIEYHEHGRDTKTQQQLFFSYRKIFQSNFNLLALPLNLFFKFIQSQIKTQNPHDHDPSNSNVPNLVMSFSKI